ncbi:MAG: hybrid sensor histidine kinase/response regulator [bacterium]|nr:hybrid sensor histidine kinase/response regulator [bacterium]
MALNISKFLDQFFMEAAERVANIQKNMLELENNPRNKDALLDIQRDMHTIKGSSRMVGLKEISEIAHHLEDAFIKLSSGFVEVNDTVMTILYRGADAMATLLYQAKSKEPLSDNHLLLKELITIADGSHPGITPEPAATTLQSDGKVEPVKRKFKLDFNILKNKLNKKKPADSTAEPTPLETDSSGETGTSADLQDNVSTAAPHPEAPAEKTGPVTAPEPGEPKPRDAGKTGRTVESIQAPTVERTYLKIDSQQFETIINQVTDLLSKRYFFNNVLQTCKNLNRMTKGMRKEWQTLKLSETAVINQFQDIEAVNNIENTIERFSKTIHTFERDYQENLTTFENALRDVYDNLLDMKLTPLSTIFAIYPRFVRDYAYRTGKKIRIYIRGSDTQLDKTVIEKINEPLIHLIRNACDHGIKSPDEREANGKPLTGTIIIEANKKGNHVEINISDDGNGLDKDAILKKAVAKGIIKEESIDKLEDQEIYALIFQSGFSTAATVSDTSGRGIGMDIVKRITHQFGGSIHTSSTPGEGTAFRLEFPVSIFTNKVTYIKEEGIVYAIPGNLIRRIVKLKREDINEKADYSVVVYNDEIYTVAKLNQVLSGETSGIGEKPVFMLLPKVTDRKIGIIVDEILYEDEVIVKDLGHFLGKRKYVYGMVIGERGELHIVLDVHDVVASDEFSKKIKIINHFRSLLPEKQTILVVDDSMLVREMEKNLLEGAGYNVVTAINGMDGYNKALSRRYDLVLADIEMPEMNGFEMIENIKKIEEYSDVPTIVLSTVEKEEDKVKGINLGVNAWMQKQDFNDTEILKVIKRFIG